MASLATLDTFAATTVKVGTEYVDYHGNVRTVQSDFDAMADAAAVQAWVDLVDPVTHARICEVMVNGADYVITGGQAADNAAHWFENSDEMVLSFRSGSRCRKKLQVIIPAPVDTNFTGVEEILVNPTNGPMAALIAYLATHLKSKDYGGLTDFIFAGGYRRKVALPTPNVQ